MESVEVVVFGYGKFGNAIAKALEYSSFTKVKLAVTNKEQFELANAQGLRVEYFYLQSDSSIGKMEISENTQLICALDSNKENLYLALTLRDLYKNNHIMAISDSTHLSEKLKMAGVNRVIDIYQTSVGLLMNILSKPFATKFLQGFIDKSHNYNFSEITIGKESSLIGHYIDMIDFKNYNIIFIGMVDQEKGEQFFFGSIGESHRVTEGDILVLIGKEEDIMEFKKACGDCR